MCEHERRGARGWEHPCGAEVGGTGLWPRCPKGEPAVSVRWVRSDCWRASRSSRYRLFIGIAINTAPTTSTCSGQRMIAAHGPSDRATRQLPIIDDAIGISCSASTCGWRDRDHLLRNLACASNGCFIRTAAERFDSGEGIASLARYHVVASTRRRCSIGCDRALGSGAQITCGAGR